MNKTLILIDGSSFVYRAFHAMPELRSPSGEPTGATYGIVNMLKQLQKKYPTSYWGCIFDVPGKTFREVLYPEYKANRPSTPKELVMQIKNIHQIITNLGIPVISQVGIEADDIIGSIAILGKSLNYKVLIATGDKDFAQLVDDDITLINTMNNELLDINGVVKKFGVNPNQIIDYLTLIGDKSDNIPGVNKCGPKTATTWLTKYHSLENIYLNLTELKGVVAANLKEAQQWLTMAKALVTIDTKLDLSQLLPDSIESLKLKTPDIEALKVQYHQLGFKTWLSQLSNDTTSAKADTISSLINPIVSPLLSPVTTKRVLIQNMEQIKQIVALLISKGELIAITIVPDMNLNSLNLSYLFISTQTTTYIINNQQQQADLLDNKTIGLDYSIAIKELLASNLPKVCYCYKDTLNLLYQNSYPLNNVVADVNIAHYLLNSRLPQVLSKIYKSYLGLDVIDIALRLSEFDKKSVLNSSTKLVENACLINENLITLEHYLLNQLSQNELNIYHNIELPIAKVLTDMENTGIQLDVNKFKQLSSTITSKIKELEDTIYKKANAVFNINSNKQLQQVLFEQMGLPTTNIAKNTTGYSTDEASLNILADSGFDIANSLLEYRNLSKLLNTYIDKLPLLVDKDQRVHTTYQQTLVTSGRLSSKEPNLQNIPIKSSYANLIRQGFIAGAGTQLIRADYSQIELRILAHLSKDEELIEAFNNKLDIHLITASEIFNKPVNSINSEERRYAKTINFSILYGKSIFGLAKELKIERNVAKEYIQKYFAKYPKILYFLEDIKEQARLNGYVSTILGRKIYLPNLNNRNKILREGEERLAINAPMQGSSADIIKLAMLNIDKWLGDNKLHSKLLLQIHDELILEVPIDEIDIVKANIANLMTNVVDLEVDLEVEMKIASSWGD